MLWEGWKGKGRRGRRVADGADGLVVVGLETPSAGRGLGGGGPEKIPDGGLGRCCGCCGYFSLGWRGCGGWGGRSGWLS